MFAPRQIRSARPTNILPFPSSLYEEADGEGVARRAGRRVPDEHGHQVAFDPTPLDKRHGWPARRRSCGRRPAASIAAGLVAHRRSPTASTDASATVLVDMTTGERVAHFAEVDATSSTTSISQAVYIRPRSASRRRPSLRGRDSQVAASRARWRGAPDHATASGGARRHRHRSRASRRCAAAPARGGRRARDRRCAARPISSSRGTSRSSPTTTRSSIRSPRAMPRSPRWARSARTSRTR